METSNSKGFLDKIASTFAVSCFLLIFWKVKKKNNLHCSTLALHRCSNSNTILLESKLVLTAANKEKNKKGSFLTPQNGSCSKTPSVVSQQRSKEWNPSGLGQWGLFLVVKHPQSSSALLGISEEIANAVEAYSDVTGFWVG